MRKPARFSCHLFRALPFAQLQLYHAKEANQGARYGSGVILRRIENKGFLMDGLTCHFERHNGGFRGELNAGERG